jgi:hypothetical protein
MAYLGAWVLYPLCVAICAKTTRFVKKKEQRNEATSSCLQIMPTLILIAFWNYKGKPMQSMGLIVFWQVSVRERG